MRTSRTRRVTRTSRNTPFAAFVTLYARTNCPTPAASIFETPEKSNTITRSPRRSRVRTWWRSVAVRGAWIRYTEVSPIDLGNDSRPPDTTCGLATRLIYKLGFLQERTRRARQSTRAGVKVSVNCPSSRRWAAVVCSVKLRALQRDRSHLQRARGTCLAAPPGNGKADPHHLYDAVAADLVHALLARFTPARPVRGPDLDATPHL
jgi:hypothetical protein